jgi:ribonuclease P protein subunit RPR2
MARYQRRLATRNKNKRIARERIFILFKMARETFDHDAKQAQHYTQLAGKIGMRFKVRIPEEFRRMRCRHCKGLILPGKNCTVRIKQKREPHVVTTCQRCGKHMRIPLKRKTRLSQQELKNHQRELM